MLFRSPIGNEAERAHFQRRLEMTLLAVVVLQATFCFVSLGTLLAGPIERERATTIQCAGHGVVASAALLAAFALRRRARSIDALDRFDAFATMLVAWLTIGFTALPPSGEGPHMVALQIVTYVNVLRAAFVPSTAVRTFVVASAALLPLLPVTMTLRTSGGPSGSLMAVWCALSAACVGAISWVVYGLGVHSSETSRIGQYVLDAKIGQGASGAVYRATHASLRRPAAVKLLTDVSPEAADRFEREVQLTARLRHPNTISIFDYGRTTDGFFYCAMEYLEGVDLHRLVEREGPQRPSRVVHFLVQICNALEEAHAAGLVHRDIKPSNVMLVPKLGVHDAIKVLDFGLVYVALGEEEATSRAVVGTPLFMAPEVILDPSRVDGRADLYSLGVTAYYLLTGRYPLEGASAVDVCIAQIYEEPEPPSSHVSGLPRSLERLLMTCLEKSPEDRPRSAAVLAAQLRACDVGPWLESEAQERWRGDSTDAAPRDTLPAAIVTT
ncbi:Serine/threonine protein kinase [Labilithrix luteola]|uniref:Serine/threonine protein kinase n=1 Tax=Labilithrix luteola TaxID=1391654 RepID=A0A0K1Q3X1_9BACT|nr:Serine/threonine protein kinase [Labilithrix luteola]